MCAATVVAPAVAAQAAAADKCHGKLAFGEIATCSSITYPKKDVYTVTTTRDGDQLQASFTSTGTPVIPDVTDAAGVHLCYLSVYPSQCRLGAAGTYTITVSLQYSGQASFRVSVQSMLTPVGCTTLPNAFFSFASTGATESVAAGSAGNCFKFNQAAGSVLRVWSPNGYPASMRGIVYDAGLQAVCPYQSGTCNLTGTGPYTLFTYEDYGNAATYRLHITRLSHPAGCGALALAAFGDPGTAAGTGTLSEIDAIGCHRVRMPAAGAFGVRLSDAQNVSWNVYDDAGAVVCQGYSQRSCHVGAAGDYSVITSGSGYNAPGSYQIAAPALFRGAGCTPAGGLSFAPDAILVHQTSAVQTNCQTFTANAGDRVQVFRAPTEYNGLATWITDAGGQPLCTDYSNEDGCALPATGQYRIVSYIAPWNAGATDQTYKVQPRRLNQAAGCPVVKVGAYNAAPAGAAGPIRCRTLDIKTPGVYIGAAFDAQNYQTYGSVYDSTGHRVCDDSTYCPIGTAGRYTMVLNSRDPNSVLDNDFVYTTSLLPFQPASCPTMGVDGYGGPNLTSAFTAPGQVLCRQVTGGAGGRIVELQPTDATGAANPTMFVADSTGNHVCDDSWSLRGSSCELTDTTANYLVLSARPGAAPGPFSIALARVDGPPACPALPRGPAATATTGASHFVACYTIPADQHGAQETFTVQRTSGSGTATLSVFDATGLRYCGPRYGVESAPTTCSGLPDGPVTVLVEVGSADATYTFAHSQPTS
nr:hypothetical protein GCM10020063_091810 [Dactylosporangium thailandense]